MSSFSLRLFEWRQSKPWRFLFFPLFPIVLLLARVRRGAGLLRPAHVRRILVVHFGAIGDLLMATPSFRVLRDSYPDAAIEILLANRGAAQVLMGNTAVSAAHVWRQYDGSGVKDLFGSEHSWRADVWTLFKAYPVLILRVLARSYDLGISLGPFPEAGTLANVLFYLAGIPSRAGCMGRHTSVLTYPVEPSALDKHWADIYLDTVAPVARVPRPASLTYEYEVAVEDECDASNLLESLGIKDGAPLAVLQPGGNLHVNSKRWDAAKFARVADWLTANQRTHILIGGSKDEYDVAQAVATAMSQPAEVVAGKLSIGQMGALLRRADWFITNDTGMLHLAEAVGTRRIVSVFGPTDPRRIAPRNARNLAVSSKLSCAPCITLDAGDPNKRCWRAIKEECLRTLSAEEVIAHIQLPVTLS